MGHVSSANCAIAYRRLHWHNNGSQRQVMHKVQQQLQVRISGCSHNRVMAYTTSVNQLFKASGHQSLLVLLSWVAWDNCLSIAQYPPAKATCKPPSKARIHGCMKCPIFVYHADYKESRDHTCIMALLACSRYPLSKTLNVFGCLPIAAAPRAGAAILSCRVCTYTMHKQSPFSLLCVGKRHLTHSSVPVYCTSIELATSRNISSSTSCKHSNSASS